MRVEAFLDWPGDGTGRLHHLVDGEVRAMAPATTVHGVVQMELGRRIANRLIENGRDCHVFTAPGVVPRVRADVNMRVPDLAVTCAPLEPGQRALPEPVLLVEILSPSNERETGEPVWT